MLLSRQDEDEDGGGDGPGERAAAVLYVHPGALFHEDGTALHCTNTSHWRSVRSEAPLPTGEDDWIEICQPCRYIRWDAALVV